MLSIETEKRVAKLFNILAEGERTIEISRRILSEIEEFEPYQIFKNIDIEGKNKIDSDNIIYYLRNKGIYVSEEEAQLIILFYDQDYDCELSYPEFINIIQSDNVIQKPLYKSSKESISFNLDYSLEKLLEKEVELARTVLYTLKDIKCRYDFNIHNIFHSVKSYNSITPDSIRYFLEKNEVSYLDSDIKSIIKRLDLNKDGRIDLFEFHALLGFPNCSYCCPCISCSSCGTSYCDSCFSDSHCYIHGKIHNKYNSPNSIKNNSIKENKMIETDNNSIKDINKMRLSNPLNNKINYNNSSPIRDNDNNDKYQKKISNSLFIKNSPERRFEPFKVDLCEICNKIPCICEQIKNNKKDIKNENNSNLNNFEKKQFNNFLKMLMKVEIEIEQKKIDLALMKDFNCEDAFRIFEKNGRGFLTKDDIKYGLYLLGINVNDFIINLLFKRFDLQNKDEINYADFFDMIIPFEKKYRNDVEQRIPHSNFQFNCIEIFSEKTIICLRNVFNLIINYENEINEMRKGFSLLIRRLKDIFKMFDTKGFGFFKFEDYINYLKNNDLLNESLNIDLLFIRLDKNRNGKIDFTEIADEINALY